MWNRTTLKSLLVPGAPLLLSAAAFAYFDWIPLPVPSLHFLYYAALAGALLLAWRFHAGRVFLAALVLFLAFEAVGPASVRQESERE